MVVLGTSQLNVFPCHVKLCHFSVGLKFQAQNMEALLREPPYEKMWNPPNKTWNPSEKTWKHPEKAWRKNNNNLETHTANKNMIVGP